MSDPLVDLDTLDLDTADPSGVLRQLAGAGARVREAQARSAEVLDVGADGRPRCLVVLAAGTDVLIGAALVAVIASASPIPVLLHTDAGLPAFIGPLDLVLGIAVDATAETAGIFAGLEEAGRRGARLAAVCPDGTPIADVTRAGRGTVFETARGAAGFWAGLAPAMAVAVACGATTLPLSALSAAADRLDELAVAVRPDAETFTNPAKHLAVDLADSLVLVWGSTPIATVSALRAAAGIRTVAGLPAFGSALGAAASDALALLDPVTEAALEDLDDDPLEALFRDRGGDADEPPPTVVIVRDSGDETPVTAALAESTARYARDRGCVVHELVSAGESRLERLASLVGLFDAAAVYAALGRGLDPGRPPAAV